MPDYCQNCFKILILCFLFTSFSCFNNRESAKKGEAALFSILEATAENWQAGIQEGGSGTDYRFATLIHTDKDLQFDSVWIAEKKISLPLSVGRLRGPVSSAPVRFSTGDTVLLVASVLSSEMPKLTSAPKAFKGDALISFRAAGKKGQEFIPAILKKQNLPRPTINSNNQ